MFKYRMSPKALACCDRPAGPIVLGYLMGRQSTYGQGVGGVVASVVIPAHNEVAVIGRCLSRLLEGAAEGELDIVVVCNGCTDATAQIARTVHGVHVIELEVASKVIALNAGDQAATAWPRVFVDADIDISGSSIKAVADALSRGPALVASPRPRIDCSASSLGVRMFYSVWTKLPYYRRGPIGMGVYALSERGRGRFEEFPDLIADDTFVECQFRSSERESVEGAEMLIRAPLGLFSLVHIESRRRAGLRQLEASGLATFPSRAEGQMRRLLTLTVWPWLWPAILVYVTVRLTAGWRAHVIAHDRAWPRDDSSRVHRVEGVSPRGRRV